MEILWVEDKYDEIGIILQGLMDCGHIIQLASDFSQADKILREGRKFDLVILDSYLPHLAGGNPSHSGCDLSNNIRKGQYGSWGTQTKLIFVTGFEKTVNGLTHDVTPLPDKILPKPLTEEKVISEINKLFPNNISIIKDGHGEQQITIQIGSSGSTKQEQKIEIDNKPFSNEEINALNNLILKWIRSNNITENKAAEHLMGIKNSNNEDKSRTLKINEFKKWLSSIGDEVSQGLAVSASGVVIATPILKMLGFPL